MCPDVEAAATKASSSAASAINKSIEDGATSEEEEDEEDTSEDESDHEQGLLSAINLYWFVLSQTRLSDSVWAQKRLAERLTPDFSL